MAKRSMQMKWITPFFVLAAFGVAVWFLFVPHNSSRSQDVRPGWQILRPPYDVNALAMFEGALIAGGRDGLVAIDPQSAHSLALPPGTPEMTYVKAILVDRAGRLWIGHRGGVAVHDGAGWEQIAANPTSPPGPVAALIETGDGRILAGGEAGLARIDEATFISLPLPPERQGSGIASLFEDRRGRIWVGLSSPNQGGLLVEDGGQWHEIGLEYGIVHLSVNSIGEDAAGHIRLATGFSGRGGACRLEDTDDFKSWTCLNSADGLASDMVRLVHEDSHGQIWYGSEFRGIAVERRGRFVRFDVSDGLAGTELKALLEDPFGNLWLGCDKGLTRIEAGSVLVTVGRG